MELSEEEKKSIKLLKNEIETIKIKIPRNFLPTYSFFKLIEDTTAVQCLINLVDKLTEKVKELEKGNRSLIESRKKWKKRYYKEKAKNKEKKAISQAIIRDTFIDRYISKEKIREIKNIYENEIEKDGILTKLNSYDLLRAVINRLEELLEGN